MIAVRDRKWGAAARGALKTLVGGSGSAPGGWRRRWPHQASRLLPCITFRIWVAYMLPMTSPPRGWGGGGRVATTGRPGRRSRGGSGPVAVVSPMACKRGLQAAQALPGALAADRPHLPSPPPPAGPAAAGGHRGQPVVPAEHAVQCQEGAASCCCQPTATPACSLPPVLPFLPPLIITLACPHTTCSMEACT